MVRQITEEQREHGRGNRIHGDDTGCMAGRDSECRGEQRQQRGNHLVVDFTEKSDAEEQQQNECRAGWILCHSMNQRQRGHKTQGTYSIEDMPGEGLSARHAMRRRNALSFTIGFETDTFPAHRIQLQERFRGRGRITRVTMAGLNHLTMVELQAGLEKIRQSPKDAGVLELIVRRPKTGARELLQEGRLDLVEGLVGRQLEHARIVSDSRRLWRIRTCS